MFSIDMLNDVISTVALTIGISIMGPSIRKNRGKYVMLYFVWLLLTLTLRYALAKWLGSYSGFLQYTLTVLTFSLMFRISLIRSVTAFIVALIPLIVVEGIGLYLFQVITGNNVVDVIKYVGVTQMITMSEVFALLLIKIFVPVRRWFNQQSMSFSAVGFIVTNMFLFLIIAKVAVDSNTFESHFGQGAIITTFALMVATNIAIIFNFVRETTRARRLEKYNDLKKTVGSVIDNNIRIQHDFKNHLNIIKTYIDRKDSKGLALIDDLTKEISKDSEYLKWNNPIIGALIHSKRAEAETKGITFKAVSYGVDDIFPIEDYHLTTIVSNLIDNAFDAAEQMPLNARSVMVEMGMDSRIYLRVKNSTKVDANVIANMFTREFSTKGDSRGMGLYGVQNIARKNNGEIDVMPLKNEIEISISFAKPRDL